MQFTSIKWQLLQAFKYKCMYILYWNATSPNKQLTHGITNPIAYLSLGVMPCLYFWNFSWGWEEAGQIKWSFVRGLDYLLGSWVTGILYFMLYSVMAKMYFYFKDVSITSWIQVGLLNLTLKLPRSDCSVYPLVTTNFLVYWLWEFGVRSEEQLQPDKFNYSHYQFARYCVDIPGRNYMLITSGS